MTSNLADLPIGRTIVVRSPAAAMGRKLGQRDMGLSGRGSTSTGARWLMRSLYAILIIAAVALVILLVAELIPESDEGLRHVFIFDLAWPVFLIGSLAVLVAGVAASIAGRGRSSAELRRYSILALAYSVVALVVLFVVGGFEL